jgi:hypothetical protein
MYIGRHVKYPLFLSHLMKFEFSQQSTEIYSNIKFHKNRPVAAEFFHGEGQTHRYYEANSRFCNFSNAPKTECKIQKNTMTV